MLKKEINENWNYFIVWKTDVTGDYNVKWNKPDFDK